MVKFSNQICLVYRCTFVMQSRQHQSSAAQMAQHTICTRKGKRKGREREKERRENAGSNRKKTKQKKKKKNNKKKKKKKKNKKKTLHAHTFSHRDPCAMTFRECKRKRQCLIVKNNISTLVFK